MIAAPLNLGTLLVVEDDEGIREAVAEILALSGYQVSTASDLTEARRRIAIEMPAILVLDLMLGTESGESLLEELADRADAAHTFLMSASPAAEGVAARFGVPLVRKPFDLDAFTALLADVRARRRPSSPAA